MTTGYYAPVGPLATLRRLARDGSLGHYQLLIAPIILQHEEAYNAFFSHYDDQFVIVDNGVIELGYPLDPRELYRAVRTVGAHLLVLPDTIDDMKMTVKQVRASLSTYRMLDQFTDVMGVVQGITYEECMECARILVEEGVDWLAVPRGLTPNLGSRIMLTQEIAETYGKPIHILGFSNDLMDDILTATAHPLVRGIDAATPLWYKARLPEFPPRDAEATLHLGRRPKDFWQMAGSEWAEHNVAVVRGWMKAGHESSIAVDALTSAAAPAPLTDR